MFIDFNKKLRYHYQNGLYAEEVGRYNDPKDCEFCVVFRGNGHSETNATTKKVFVVYPHISCNDICLDNYPEIVPWELKDIKLDVWYRDKDNPREYSKITYLNAKYSQINLGYKVDLYTVEYLVANCEYTLDNPLDHNAKWLPCTKEVAK